MARCQTAHCMTDKTILTKVTLVIPISLKAVKKGLLRLLEKILSTQRFSDSMIRCQSNMTDASI